jgi:tetratricopeptide (TPR) repeat protein
MRQAIALAEESGDPGLYVGIAVGAYAFFCMGENREGVAICDRAIELADGDPTVGAGINIGCPYAYYHALKGLNLVSLGELEQARQLIERGRKIAREQGDIEVVGFSHMISVWLSYFVGEGEVALDHARQGLEIAERTGSSFSRANTRLFLGLAEGMRGKWRHAIEALEGSGVIARERRTTIESEPLRLALLGESYFGLGDPERARALVTEGLAIAQAQAQLFNETHASLALARVLLGSAGVAARAQIEATPS